MDNHTQQQLDELIAELKSSGAQISDPVAKLMVVTLLHQAQKIKDELDAIPQRIVERLCSTFVPKNKIEALPSLALVQASVKPKREIEPHKVQDGAFFSYKIDAKQFLSFYPLYDSLILPFSNTYLVTSSFMRTPDSHVHLNGTKKGLVWLGLETDCEFESLNHASFLIRGTSGVLPQRILVGPDLTDLAFASADRFDTIKMMEPFDSQQMNSTNLSLMSHLQKNLMQTPDSRLVFITDRKKDRDLYRLKAFPKSFQQTLESTDLDKFADNILWILFDFGSDYSIPDTVEIVPNVIPVVNVAVNSVTLTQTSPIAKLTKNDGSFFLSVRETPLEHQKRGFNVNADEFSIRDFDSRTYNPDNLVKDVRNLYNHFIEDYYAFIEYHGLKDGELVKSLRETVNKIGKSALSNPDALNRFDEGVYAMRNIQLMGQPLPVKVSYMTTMGKKGNLPKAGEAMENKKDAAIEKEVKVIVGAFGGEDRATADQMYELLRYYTLTSDRLYTKMDIDAFLRLHLLKEFGKDEAERISYTLRVQGAEGEKGLQRGLYIDIRFKDDKNYQKAIGSDLQARLHQLISDHSCIAMPIYLRLYLSEQ